jgi:type II secretory pathway pseudopilin PulG
MRKRPFSLVEVMIAMGIIVLCGAMLVINFTKSRTEQQEKDTLDIIKSKLRMASQLAKITDFEVQVAFDNTDGEYSIFFSPDMRVSERMKINVCRRTPLKLVREISISPDPGYLHISYFPDTSCQEVVVSFHSGHKATIIPSKYVADSFVDEAGEIERLYPKEVLQDEKEKS